MGLRPLVIVYLFRAGIDPIHFRLQWKWNESGFKPPLCTYRLNWARITFWGWWDDTVLQTHDSKFEPWRSEAEHATSRSRRLPTILTFTRGWGRNNFVSFKPPRAGTEPRTLAWKAAVQTTTLRPPPLDVYGCQNLTCKVDHRAESNRYRDLGIIGSDLAYDPLTAGVAHIPVSFFISTLSTTF